jgi:hypothetical protein
MLIPMPGHTVVKRKESKSDILIKTDENPVAEALSGDLEGSFVVLDKNYESYPYEDIEVIRSDDILGVLV